MLAVAITSRILKTRRKPSMGWVKSSSGPESNATPPELHETVLRNFGPVGRYNRPTCSRVATLRRDSLGSCRQSKFVQENQDSCKNCAKYQCVDCRCDTQRWCRGRWKIGF